MMVAQITWASVSSGFICIAIRTWSSGNKEDKWYKSLSLSAMKAEETEGESIEVFDESCPPWEEEVVQEVDVTSHGSEYDLLPAEQDVGTGLE